MLITSVNNEKIKKISLLRDKKTRDKEGLFIVEGDHLVNEAIKHNVLVTLFVLDGYEFDYAEERYELTENVMKKLSFSKSIPKVLGVCKKLKNREIEGNVLLLDNIQDPGNLGTIIRSSVAFNVDTIVISKDSVDVYNDKVIRSTEGNIFNINIIKGNLMEIINNLKINGYTILGTNVEKGSDVKDISFTKYALIMGNEGKGISKEVMDTCDNNLFIKMNSKCESLNVAVATSILLYELERR